MAAMFLAHDIPEQQLKQIHRNGSEDERPILELAETVLRLTGSASRIEYLPMPEDDPKVRRPDIARAFELLGWRPEVDLETGIRKSIQFFTERGCS